MIDNMWEYYNAIFKLQNTYTICIQIMLYVLQALKCTALYLILAPYDNEQSDLIHRLQEDKHLEDLPVYKWDWTQQEFIEYLEKST